MAKERIAYYDNAKIIMVFLVILGHFGFCLRESTEMGAWMNIIGSFVIQGFVLLSGYASKNITAQRKQDIDKVLIPYFILELIHFLYTKLTGLGDGNLNLFIPTFQNWYILALFFWRLLLPYFRFFKLQHGLAIALLLGLGAGFIKQFDSFLALHRMLFFLPFYVAGYYMNDLYAILKKLKKFKIWFVLYLILSSALIYYFCTLDVEYSELMVYTSAPMFGGYLEDFNKFIYRCIFVLNSIPAGIGILLLIPEKKIFLTKAGESSLYVYLFHMFFVWALIPFLTDYIPVLTELICAILSFIITLVLTRKPVTGILEYILNPGKILKRE